MHWHLTHQEGGPTYPQTQKTPFSSHPKKPPIYTVQNVSATSTRSVQLAYALFPPTRTRQMQMQIQIQTHGVAVTKRYSNNKKAKFLTTL